MWRHIHGVRPLTEPERVEAVEQLLSATVEADGERRCLTAFVEAYRRGLRMPVLDEA